MPHITRIEMLESRRLLSATLDGLLPGNSVSLGSNSYFTVSDGHHGRELWKSDGTGAGTVMVKDIVPGAAGSTPTSLTVFDVHTVVFFTTGTDGSRALWRSNGRSAGTTQIANFGTNAELSAISVANGRAIFVVGDTSTLSIDLWSSDGTTAGTKKISHLYDAPSADFQIRAVARVVGNRVLIEDALRLWSTDGTSAGTLELTPFLRANPSQHAMAIGLSEPVGGASLFVASSEPGKVDVWRTDGTRAGTQIIGSASGGTMGVLVKAADRVFFPIPHPDGTATLWSSDGTADGTGKVFDFSHSITGLVALDGRVLVTLRQAANPDLYEIWITDGTTDGTVQIQPSRQGKVGGAYLLGGEYFFTTYVDRGDNEAPLQLWKTDGTASGTVLVEDLAPKGVTQRTWIDVVENRLMVSPLDHHTLLFFEPRTPDVPAETVFETSKLSADGVLRIYATQKSDAIRIYPHATNSARFVIDLNGTKRSYALADVRKLIVYSYGGDDVIAVKETSRLLTLRCEIFAGDGNDQVYSGSGRDTVFGDAGNDVISTGRSADMVFGGNGDDSMYGSTGDDTLDGEGGTDRLTGGRGDDILACGDDPTRDRLDGSDGADLFFGNATFALFYKGQRGPDPSGLDALLLD